MINTVDSTMKSPEVYSQLKSELAPWFKSAGFRRVKGLLGWSRPCGDAHTVAWCQISQDGWDSSAGSKFVVEFQRSVEPVIGKDPAIRKRIASFLTPEEREDVRSIQNAVIGELRHPQPSHPTLHISPQVTEWYLKKFKSVTTPYSDLDDIWFRYYSPQHVIQWARFITSKLPRCIREVEGWDLDTTKTNSLHFVQPGAERQGAAE